MSNNNPALYKLRKVQTSFNTKFQIDQCRSIQQRTNMLWFIEEDELQYIDLFNAVEKQ